MSNSDYSSLFNSHPQRKSDCAEDINSGNNEEMASNSERIEVNENSAIRKAQGETSPSTGEENANDVEMVDVTRQKESRPRLLASKSKEEWVSSIKRFGWEGLLYKDFSVLEAPSDHPSHEGISLRYWTTQIKKTPESFKKLKSLYFGPTSVGLYRLSSHLPSETIVTMLISDITSLLQTVENEKLCSSAPHLYFATSGGFSYDYVFDEDPPRYRCFLYMGTEYFDLVSEDIFQFEEGEQFGQAYIATADAETLKNFGDRKELTMTALYREAHRKFRMHTGDVVIITGGYPFVVDLPILQRVVRSRMLTWGVYPEQTSSTSTPVLSFPKRIPYLEDIIKDDKEAMTYYGTEMTEIENAPVGARDIGDTNDYMERLRVTGRYYDEDEIRTRIQGTKGVYDITEWIN